MKIMSEVHISNLKTLCTAVLEGKYGKDVKLFGNIYYAIRVRSLKTDKWHTSTRLPKVELHEWRQMLKDADVAAEINRLREK